MARKLSTAAYGQKEDAPSLLSARFQVDLAVMVGARQHLSHRPTGTGSDESPFRVIRIHQPGLPVRLDVWDGIRNLEPWYPRIHI